MSGTAKLWAKAAGAARATAGAAAIVLVAKAAAGAAANDLVAKGAAAKALEYVATGAAKATGAAAMAGAAAYEPLAAKLESYKPLADVAMALPETAKPLPEAMALPAANEASKEPEPNDPKLDIITFT